jgi:hypothetical protein
VVGKDGDADDNPKYRIKFGDNDGDERELTAKQIASTFDRYGKLNQTMDYMRPVMNLAASVLQQNPNMTPDQLVQSFVQMANRPMTHGGQDARPNQQGQQNPQSASDISAQFEQWEKENAATLPPGYKEMHMQNMQTQQQMSQMMNMMQQMLGRTQGVMDASRAATGDARNQTINATKQKISNNLNAVQQKLGLPDEQGQEFLSFAAERGYTFEDFVDPMLTLRVASDFKNSKNAGEFGRLTDMAQRRQAFTGTAATQPAMGGAASNAGDPNLEAMINRAMSR